MKRIRIGVISFEHMHALAYTTALKNTPDVELVGIADADSFRGTEMASRFDTAYFSDYKELLAKELDGVVVCTCNKLHAPVVVDAASRVKAILVEKPFAVDAVSATAMLAACRKSGTTIMTAFPLRFNQAVINAKRAVDAGEIGEILSITGINHGKIPSGWFLDKELAGGGAVMDHTVHVADLMRWFTGSEVKSVYAESGALIHNKGIDDCGLLCVEFENGVFASIDTSWAHHARYPIWPEVYLEIVGSAGVLIVDAFKQVDHVYAEQDASDEGWGSNGDYGLVAEFVDAIRMKRTPSVTGVDGARAMEIALGAYEASSRHEPTTLRRASY